MANIISTLSSICEIKLPVDEALQIRKNRLVSSEGDNGKRISIVTGIHGDELEGQFVCFEVINRIKSNPEALKGIVDIYPAMNPLGIDSVTRGIPGFELDMNRIFPGDLNGGMVEHLAAKIVEDICGSALCVDIHASNVFLTEIPQIRINELYREQTLELAKCMNVDFIWIHGVSTVLEATLAHNLNCRNTPTLVLEAGVGMRITKKYCEQIVDGLFYTMKQLGIWEGEVSPVREPLISNVEDNICYFNAPKPGIFVADAKHWELLEAGEVVGRIINPLTGAVEAFVKTPKRGILFTIREHPVVNEGTLVGRLLVQEK